MEIENQKLKESHIGLYVTYVPTGERGVISSYNDRFVFVRFDGVNSQACPPNKLIWG